MMRASTCDYHRTSGELGKTGTDYGHARVFSVTIFDLQKPLAVLIS